MDQKMLDLILQTSGGKFYWTFPRDHCLSMDIFVGADALFSFILTIPLVCLLVLVSEAPVRVLGRRGEFQGQLEQFLGASERPRASSI